MLCNSVYICDWKMIPVSVYYLSKRTLAGFYEALNNVIGVSYVLNYVLGTKIDTVTDPNGAGYDYLLLGSKIVASNPEVITPVVIDIFRSITNEYTVVSITELPC